MAARQPFQSYLLGLVALWLPALVLAQAATGDGVLPGDLRVARWIQGFDGPVAEALAEFGNAAGAYWAGLALSVPVLAVLGWRRRWRAVVLLVAVALVRALNNTVKGWIDSPRPTPELVRVTEDAHGLGFPSGHAMGSALLFGALAFLAWREMAPGRARLVAVGACLAVIPLVGFGRVWTGAHWPSDVVGGYLLGAALLLSLLGLLRLVDARAGLRSGRHAGPRIHMAADGGVGER